MYGVSAAVRRPHFCDTRAAEVAGAGTAAMPTPSTAALGGPAAAPWVCMPVAPTPPTIGGLPAAPLLVANGDPGSGQSRCRRRLVRGCYPMAGWGPHALSRMGVCVVAPAAAARDGNGHRGGVGYHPRPVRAAPPWPPWVSAAAAATTKLCRLAAAPPRPAVAVCGAVGKRTGGGARRAASKGGGVGGVHHPPACQRLARSRRVWGRAARRAAL